ncbi:SIMPL domain-containing protein [Paenibacillus sp. GCM10023250]|uniref:SIMPL domain-containing protein n=1 Tax=Paenibacillus sp. GCM10023250 TaxID=3252648 RepID=UPI0036106E00
MYSDQPAHRTAASSASQCPATIEVIGEGTVTATPDQAVVVLGTISEGSDLQTVQSVNAATVTNIIDDMLQLNIPRENMQTSDYRIEAQYDFEEGQSIFRGYKVTHLLQITLDHIGQTGTVVDTAVDAGANQVSSIRFQLKQPALYDNQALSLAVLNAQQKAASIAGTLGIPLPAVPSKVREMPDSANAIPFAPSLLAKSAATPISPGQMNITASVQVTYQIH